MRIIIHAKGESGKTIKARKNFTKRTQKQFVSLYMIKNGNSVRID